VFISADANDPECAIFAAGEAYRQIGRVDVLLNSTVGSFQPELFHNIPMTDILPTLLQQVAAPLLMSRAILPQMRERRSGVILNIASDAGKLATPGEAVIGAATAGIVMFTRALAMEARRDGVRVNAITPSLIDNTGSLTRIRQSAFASRLFAKAGRAALLGLVQPEDMAELIVFLSSPAAKLMTGQAISLNGGISAA
jgi:NAD(P)-dependent dehydrogenase (short-subunit alcohol dehydrogenase family)